MSFTSIHRTFAFIAVVGMASVAGAQNSANASVTANVQQPITVTKTNDLAFGNVFPGVNSTVAVTSASAAAFTIQGQASTPVNMTFTLPTNLSDGASHTLPIATWTGRSNTTNSSASGTDFTPAATPVAVTLSGTGFLYVFVGATVQPAIAQVAGTYTGTATLTVVYF